MTRAYDDLKNEEETDRQIKEALVRGDHKLAKAHTEASKVENAPIGEIL